MIKAAIFDVGGVLIDNPLHEMMAYDARKLNIPEDTLASIFNSLQPIWQTGETSEEEFWQKVSQMIGQSFPIPQNLWVEGLKSAYQEKPEVFSIIRDLKDKGLKVAVLSNCEPSVPDFIRQHDNFKLFDILIFSCEVGLRKPGQEIFELTLKKLSVLPEEAIFIDDKTENIEGAKAVGLKTILFESEKQLMKELGEFLNQ